MNKKMITLILTIIIVVATAIVNFMSEPTPKIEVVIDSTKTADSIVMDSTVAVKDSVPVVPTKVPTK